MGRGPKKHLKRLVAPKNWYLSKLGGQYAPRPRAGPHKLFECMPIVILIRNLLRYAHTYHEAKIIANSRYIEVNGKVRTDIKFPVGIQDVVYLKKADKYFRILYDPKGRFVAHSIQPNEAKFKLSKVKKICIGDHGIPYGVTHDGRTINYLHPSVKVNDTLRLDIESGKVLDIAPYQKESFALIIGGRNIGRIGRIKTIEPHPGSFTIVKVEDGAGSSFYTRQENIFVIGTDKNLWITIPKGNGIRHSLLQEQAMRLSKKAH